MGCPWPVSTVRRDAATCLKLREKPTLRGHRISVEIDPKADTTEENDSGSAFRGTLRLFLVASAPGHWRQGRLNPKKAWWDLRGTEELTLCACGWPLGFKGVGEIRVAAMIASVVYHATGSACATCGQAG